LDGGAALYDPLFSRGEALESRFRLSGPSNFKGDRSNARLAPILAVPVAGRCSRTRTFVGECRGRGGMREASFLAPFRNSAALT
jgi:hypothetical protein